MKFTPTRLDALDGKFRLIKTPDADRPEAQRDPKVVETVSEMLSTIERRGIDAVKEYAQQLDGYESEAFGLGAAELAASGDVLSSELRAALELGSERTKAFARETRSHLVDFEIELAPGLVTGQRYVPLDRVGAYVPAGRFPLLAGAFMTAGVAKVAGVSRVLACTPPRRDGTADPAVLYAAHLAGVDQMYVLGGVQALAAMAFGLLDDDPVDMIVGAGNAFVAEAKRQLFGKVAIDLLAGPSEVAVIADHTADARVVAADLLGQAEHGTESPAALVTTSEQLARDVVAAVEDQLGELKTADIAGPAWRDYGSVTWAQDQETAIALMDDLAPEHLEIQTEDDDFYHRNLRNYGSIFLGPWSTVAYSDKGMAGTNHVLPTAGGARHSAGLSVSRYLKPLTYQRVSREATPAAAGAVETISRYEGMAAHEATATVRFEAYRRQEA
ncbi:histidinol dehydrogenase [Gordonia otitidis]|uniref:Histidinol dehydrogenase n=1 Tax=Gordonia otitidis (strain DSM 44809 / CCUG 52243 / JCM 12355 / NBRC 100426 / IFM 10032) TaxID=1108044 RepID=H5TU66_GORO1|nr:histidinol dehydrogenase [Gordonia otitidis]GAB37024.1 histidinol dehydrogenase [Gordonia otitidis NBRC 100426]